MDNDQFEHGDNDGCGFVILFIIIMYFLFKILI